MIQLIVCDIPEWGSIQRVKGREGEVSLNKTLGSLQRSIKVSERERTRHWGRWRGERRCRRHTRVTGSSQTNLESIGRVLNLPPRLNNCSRSPWERSAFMSCRSSSSAAGEALEIGANPHPPFEVLKDRVDSSAGGQRRRRTSGRHLDNSANCTASLSTTR